MALDFISLRRRVDALGARSRSRRYPAELRAMLCAAVRAARAEGQTVAAISAAVGVPWETLSRWTGAATTSTPSHQPRASFRPVELVEATPPRSPLVVHGPLGLRVELADVAALAELLRALA